MGCGLGLGLDNSGLGLGLGLGLFSLDSDSDLLTSAGLGLGLGLESCGLGLGLGHCWTRYKSGPHTASMLRNNSKRDEMAFVQVVPTSEMIVCYSIANSNFTLICCTN